MARGGGVKYGFPTKMRQCSLKSAYLSPSAFPFILHSLINDSSFLKVLRAFGRHWILFTAAEGYGGLLDITGSDLKTFLSNLNHMHSQVASSMLELEPPSFSVEELENGVLCVHYVTERKGLSPMVVGLLEGLAEKFSVSADVVQTQFVDHGDEHDVFEIRPS